MTRGERKKAVFLYEKIRNYKTVSQIFGVSYQAIQQLVKNKEKVIAAVDENKKGHSKVKYPVVEHFLMKVIIWCRANRMNISGL